MLARLISANQVVLLCDFPDVYLFFHGRVYTRSSWPFNLPKRRKMPYWPVWTLIDMGCDGAAPPLSGSPNVWPIHTTSRNADQWKGWRKQYGATLLGMPLWDEEELVRGYVLSSLSLSEVRR